MFFQSCQIFAASPLFLLGRQVKMAFVHGMAKPPRNIRRQQEIYGTAGPVQLQPEWVLTCIFGKEMSGFPATFANQECTSRKCLMVSKVACCRKTSGSVQTVFLGLLPAIIDLLAQVSPNPGPHTGSRFGKKASSPPPPKERHLQLCILCADQLERNTVPWQNRKLHSLAEGFFQTRDPAHELWFGEPCARYIPGWNPHWK